MNLLFICSYNRMRSPTAEIIYSSVEFYQVRSAGTERMGKRKITRSLIVWADIIFVMEKEHETILNEKFPEEAGGKKIVILDIPDNYCFMEQELIDLIKARVSPYLTKPKDDADTIT
jgi:predicted protein tyrosine phosphatase